MFDEARYTSIHVYVYLHLLYMTSTRQDKPVIWNSNLISIWLKPELKQPILLDPATAASFRAYSPVSSTATVHLCQSITRSLLDVTMTCPTKNWSGTKNVSSSISLDLFRQEKYLLDNPFDKATLRKSWKVWCFLPFQTWATSVDGWISPPYTISLDGAPYQALPSIPL